MPKPKRYPDNWGEIALSVKENALWRCACVPSTMPHIMSGSITIIKPQLGATNGNLSNLELIPILQKNDTIRLKRVRMIV